MEYVFGTKGDAEILKVKSAAGTDLTGFQQVTLTTDVDQTRHTFRVLRKYRRETGCDAMIYDFYEIDRHNTAIDKTEPLKQELAATNAILDDIIVNMLEG